MVDLNIGVASVQVIVVHMKSGLLDDAPDESSERRAAECRRLLEWVGAAPEWVGAAPGSPRIIVGDFNARPTHVSIAAVRNATGWTWPPHRWPAGARRWTTHLDSFGFDPCVIDHVALFGLNSDSLNVHCFDLDEVRTRDGLTWRAWLATDGHDETRLRRVSDHRRVYLDLEL